MPLGPGVSWARFGNETLFFSDDEAKPAATASRGARIPYREAEVTKEQLYVVVQHGRTFQDHNPDVPVLHDRGRFLLVKLDRQKATRLAKKHQTCYGVMPLAENEAVFEVRRRSAARAPSAFVQELVNKVNRTTLEKDLTHLVSFTTRHSTSAGFGEAGAWAEKQLKTMGFQTRKQTVSVNGVNSRNIIADKPGQGGTAATRKVVIVCAHLDSVNLQGGPSAKAPGADDNGSGSAGLLEIARAFQAHRAKDDLRLILFGGEEQGLFGSKHFVGTLNATQRNKIRAVVNMDMIGSMNSDTRSVLIEGSPLSQAVIDGLSEAGDTYTQLSIETSLNPFSSDHVPFINAQIPAVLTIEGADNTNENIHSAKDTIDKIDYETALEILRMNVGFVATEIGKAP
jgi:Zn-dependent M28 family amino/carboxypeptidase